jgi:RHS repeat-associated protein
MKSGTTALVISAKADYYPFGMAMPNATTGDYRYAFQGQEKDPETGMEAFELRMWDGRLGRWLSPDPYGQYASPYLGMGNNPVSSIDPDGGWDKKFGAWLHGLFDGKDGTVFQSERGDWGIRYEGQTINGEITVYTPNFGGKRYDVFRQEKLEKYEDGLAEYRTFHPSEFGDISLWDENFEGGRLSSIASAFQLVNPVLPGMNGGKQAVEGIYEFTAASGKRYVGQSGNIAARLEQHKASGKLLTGTPVKTTQVLGGKTAREIAEQLRINSLGGIRNLDNIRNPIGRARQHLLPKTP